MTPQQRFDKKVRKTDECWLWVGATFVATGYGMFYFNGKRSLAHRASYRLFVGEIPPGQVVHHRCGVRRCVRPDHLALTTRAEHPKEHQLREHCRRGHLLDDVYVTKGGLRKCRKCRRYRRALG